MSPERRNLGTRGPLMATSTNAGKKIPTVAAIAPHPPPRSRVIYLFFGLSLRVARLLRLFRFLGGPPGPPDHPDLSRLFSAAEELIASIGFESRDADSAWHLDAFKNFSSLRIDSSQITFAIFQGGMPQLSIDPRDAGDESVRVDCAQNLSRVGIDLIDLPVAVLPDPERPLGPGKARVPAATGRRDGRNDAARPGINLLDTILGDLIDTFAVEGRSGMRSDIDRAQHLSARRIYDVQLVARSKPDMLPVIGDPMHSFGTRKGAILADDLSI